MNAIDIKRDAVNMFISIDDEDLVLSIRNFIADIFQKWKTKSHRDIPTINPTVDFSFVDDIFGKLDDKEAEEMRKHCHVNFEEVEV